MGKTSLIKRENTVIVVVTYNPSDELRVALERYMGLVDRVVIVDNASSHLGIEERQGLDIIYSDKNRGIAWGLNEGIRKALSYSPDWIVSFDQDSIPAYNIFDIYNTLLTQYQGKMPIGLMCGGFNLREEKMGDPVLWESSLVLITSAMAHRVDLFEKVGLYNEELFIDSVDFEYVMRTRLAGFATLRIKNDVIFHKIGNPLVGRIGPFRIESSNHSAFRRYYQGRNLVYLTRRFIGKFPLQILNFNYYFFFKVLPRMILVERPLLPKLKALFRGMGEGLKESFYSHPSVEQSELLKD